jgi:hypothetical protein
MRKVRSSSDCRGVDERLDFIDVFTHDAEEQWDVSSFEACAEGIKKVEAERDPAGWNTVGSWAEHISRSTVPPPRPAK